MGSLALADEEDEDDDIFALPKLPDDIGEMLIDMLSCTWAGRCKGSDLRANPRIARGIEALKDVVAVLSHMQLEINFARTISHSHAWL